jgi:4-amino-4-deoxy-L-arabinose transferase-like glycosyltransferase
MNDSRDRGWLRDGSPRARSLALGVLILVATGLRITQAGRLECISRDGVGYVRFARELAEDARYYLRAELSQPGYSAAVLATQRTIGPWLSGDPVLAWERSGQFVAVLGGVAVVPLIYLLAAQLFDQRIALIAGGLAAIWPFAVDSSADVLTDQPHLALYLACVVAAAGALRRGRAVYLLPVGVLAGVAYLFRQEALALPIGVGAWWMVSARSRVAVRSAGVLLLLAGFALAVAPYVAATGKLTHKKSLRQVILGQPEPQAAAREHDATARAAAVRGVEIPLRAAEQWARCGQYVIGLLAILGWVWRGVPRSAAGPRRLVLLLAGLHVLAVLARGRSYGEISTRYMLIPTAISIPWAAAALDARGRRRPWSWRSRRF